jgi:hypothetical protein
MIALELMEIPRVVFIAIAPLEIIVGLALFTSGQKY